MMSYFALAFLMPLLPLVALCAPVLMFEAGHSEGSASVAEPAVTCVLRAETELQVYMRPGSGSDVFGLLAAGETVLAEARTAEGWLGFDPGVAQAANVGVLRLRWVHMDSVTVVGGNVDALPVCWAPSPTGTYATVVGSTNLRSEPDSTSTVVTLMQAGTIARVTGRSGDGWLLLNLGEGQPGEFHEGWALGSLLSINGDIDTVRVVVDWNN